MKKDLREQLEERIEKYFDEGYKIEETMKEMPDVLLDTFNHSEDEFYSFVSGAYDRFKKKKTKDELDKIKEKKNDRKRAALTAYYQILADKVVERAEADKSGSLRQRLSKACNQIAFVENISLEFVRSAAKTIYPEWFDHYNNNRNYTPEYFVNMAETIVAKNLYYAEASNIPGYFMMIKYIKTNRPDLYGQIREVYDSHATKFEMEPYPTNLANQDMLFKILFEYRVPIANFCEFINNNTEIFLKNKSYITENELLEEIAKNKIYSETSAIQWFLHEVSTPDEFTDYRISRFTEFAIIFKKAKNNPEQLKKYVNSVTNIKLESIYKKTGEHIKTDSYDFTMDDIRILTRYIYNFGLTREEAKKNLYMTWIHKGWYASKLGNSNDIYDRMLASGIQKLGEYGHDKAYVSRFGTRYGTSKN